MRETNPYAGKADMALLFRDIQLATMPDLSTEQYQDAFGDSLLQDLARWGGAVPHNPADPAVKAEHAPHVQAARRR
jgi:hypothetical protein